MKKEILERIPPDALRRLARRKGHPAPELEPPEQLASWLFSRYVEDITRGARGQSASLVERARRSLETIRARLPLLSEPTGEPEGRFADVRDDDPPAVVPDDIPCAPSTAPRDDREPEHEAPAPVAPSQEPSTIPTDPLMRTLTLARVYENQGMMDEALLIYQEVLRDDPQSTQALQGVSRVTARFTGAESEDHEMDDADLPPAVGADVWDPSSEPEASLDDLPVDIPDLKDLPLRHGVDEGVLLMVTPHVLFCCWEVTPGTFERARQGVDADARLVLRVVRVDVSGTEPSTAVHSSHDISDTVGEYFVHGVEPSALYHAEIGLLSGERYASMLRTNVAATPPGGPSGRVDEQWGGVDQRALDRRGLLAPAPRMGHRSSLDAREMALLKLHDIGPEAYSSLTGIDLGRLRDLLARTPGRVHTDRPDGISSGARGAPADAE